MLLLPPVRPLLPCFQSELVTQMRCPVPIYRIDNSFVVLTKNVGPFQSISKQLQVVQGCNAITNVVDVSDTLFLGLPLSTVSLAGMF